MPIYEYECTSCGLRHEAIQKMSDAPLVDCPSCNKAELKKLVSAPGFRLKGGGWYETDFKSGQKKNLVQADKGAPKSPSSSGDSTKNSAKTSSS